MKVADYAKAHGPWAQVYHHVADDGENIWIAVAPLRKEAERYLKPELVPLDPKVADKIVEESIEPRRMEELIQKLVRKGMKQLPGHDPVLIAFMPDGKWLLVDGNHRYAIASLLGMKKIRAYVCYPPLWKQFQLTDLPQQNR
jgi:hypothetical protein